MKDFKQPVDNMSMTKGQHEMLTEAMRNNKSIIIAGGINSGKTKLLNYMLKFRNGKITLIDDISEVILSEPLERDKSKHSNKILVVSDISNDPKTLLTAMMKKETFLTTMHFNGEGLDYKYDWKPTFKSNFKFEDNKNIYDILDYNEFILIFLGTRKDGVKYIPHISTYPTKFGKSVK